ncbi:hypothetical protein [Achromobacter piechaudii]|uniref:hypothetical protein n=1 Tax=Achromobacter piechaudii TaxID=72556 RepID=UPI001582D4EF|nr:hypothetical protein [Achromobacter piechaudii]
MTETKPARSSEYSVELTPDSYGDKKQQPKSKNPDSQGHAGVCLQTELATA